MEGQFSVRLVRRLAESELDVAALRAAEELNVSILKLTQLLKAGPGMVTKPLPEATALRVAEVLASAGAEVEVVPVRWEALLVLEENRGRRPVTRELLGSGEWPPPVVRELPPAAVGLVPEAMRPLRQRPPGFQRSRRRWRTGPIALLATVALGAVFWLNQSPLEEVREASLTSFPAPAPTSFEAGRYAFETRNYAEAQAQWQPLAAAGDAGAQYGLARLYGNGLGLERDLSSAARWYEEAAQQGHAAAQYELGWLYGNGLGVERDLPRAVQWYQAAAEQGHAAAQYQLGLHTLYGQGVRRDAASAAAWFRAAAEQGGAEAQYRLGVMLLEGQGVTRDLPLAERWLRLANHQGVSEAKPYLAVLELSRGALPQTAQAPPVTPPATALATPLVVPTAPALPGALPSLVSLHEAGADDVAPELLETESRTAAIAVAPGDVVPEALREAVPSLAEAETPQDIFLLAREGAPEAVLRALLQGADPNSRDAYGQTPLMYAASANTPEAVRELIGGGAEVNAQSEAGWTALMYAARDNPATLEPLLTAGADPDLRNADGESAADILSAFHPAVATTLADLLSEE